MRWAWLLISGHQGGLLRDVRQDVRMPWIQHWKVTTWCWCSFGDGGGGWHGRKAFQGCPCCRPGGWRWQGGGEDLSMEGFELPHGLLLVGVEQKYHHHYQQLEKKADTSGLNNDTIRVNVIGGLRVCMFCHFKKTTIIWRNVDPFYDFGLAPSK